MTIAFRDFVPTVTKRGVASKEHERLSETVARANAWISSSAVRVINVETVVRPTILGAYELIGWDEFVRVWYEDPERSA